MGLAGRERERTNMSTTVLGTLHRFPHLSSEQACEIDTIILFLAETQTVTCLDVGERLC